MLTHSFGRKAWRSLVVAGVAGMLGLVPSLQAQEPTPKLIPFEGQLVRDGAPITDTCALQFRVFDAPTGGKQIGAPIERPDVAVQGGYFMVTLDPSDAARLAPPHHLELAAKCGAETEFAVQGERLPLIAMDENAQALAAPAAARAGAATTEVAPQATTDTFWKLAGNAGTVLGQHKLGTTDNVGLDVVVNNAPALRLRPTPGGPNVIGGLAQNSVGPGASGVTVAGGGSRNATTGQTFPHRAFDNTGTIGGGSRNTVGTDDGSVTSATGATVAGGIGNTASGSQSTVAGGINNTAGPGGAATVGGGIVNTASGVRSTVSGGEANQATNTNATVGGGINNTASGSASMIGGGENNTAGGAHASVDGGRANTASGQEAVVGGGSNNRASGQQATVGGGLNNQATNQKAVVGGGRDNKATGEGSTVGGGGLNDATGQVSTVAGGLANDADGIGATIGGGEGNAAEGDRATVPGGIFNAANGENSFAAGRQARANHDGSFVWSDSSGSSLNSDGANSFTVRASGGTTFFSGATSGVELPPGGGAWNSLSDRNAKEHFAPVDPLAVLQQVANLPITTWNYTSQDGSIRHMGPVAQDFQAAFNLGENDTTISTVDADGVALAAIQGLYSMVQEQNAQLAAQQQQMEQLLSQLEALQQQPNATR